VTSRRSTGRSARSSSPSRRELGRRLAINALTKPVNVAVPAAIVVAGLLLGASWLIAVAAVCWAALVGGTFFDEREARAVGERARDERRAPPAVVTDRPAFAAEIDARVRAAVSARAAIRAAIEESDLPHEDVTEEVDALLEAMQADAQRAQRIHQFLAEVPPEQLDPQTLQRVRSRLDRLLDELDRIVGTLQTVRAEILVTDGLAAHGELSAQLSELRVNVQLVSAGLEDAFDGVRRDTKGA
jgi:hypothetical protein